MRKLLTILFLFPLIAFGQQESHNFTTYDTTFVASFGNGEAWQARISRPVNLFTAGNPDTASRPLIIMLPGQGQMGNTNPANLTTFGPHFWLNNGWDGSVVLGNGKHYPIIVTLAAITNTIPSPVQLYPVLQYLIQKYHAKAGCVYGTGLSEGSFTIMGMIEYEQTIGFQTGMKLLNAIVGLEGTPSVAYFTSPSWPTPYPNSQWADTAYFATWATVYNGRLFYLEGSGSDNFRDGWRYTRTMNNVVPKSGYFSYENAGGGAHCCWNTMYDPSQTNWTSVGTLGPTNAPSQAGTNTMGSYTYGNVYQWMLQQGDTSLVGSGATPPSSNAGGNQMITLPTSSVTLSGSGSAISPATSVTYAWTQTSGPNTASFSSTTTATPTVSSMIPGTYVFKLTVTDNNSNTSNASTTVTVNPSPASPGCRAYYWDTTNINVAITNANYPSINACDTIYVDPCKPQAGYRSLAIKLTAGTPWRYSTLDSNRINIIFRNAAAYGTIKTNSSGNMFANSIDASSNLLIKGLKMYDHTDPLFATVTATGYLHHIKFEKDTLQNIPGLWGSGPITTTLANFTGNKDTVNCNYDIRFHGCIFDTVGNTSFGGLVAMWIGGFKPNQVWVRTEIDSCLFNYAPSPTGSGPACFIHAQQAYMIKIHDNTFTNLGIVAHPEGHAASIFMQGSLFDIYHNIFKYNFANCVRAISSATVPGMNSLFTSWDPNYDGVGRFWGNILDSGRKYPMIESQKDTIGFTGLSYWQTMRSPRVWNNTMYRGGTGAGNQPYNVSLYDWYDVAYTADTVEMHNNIEVGPPTDTVGTMTSSQATVALLTRPSGTTAIYDSSGNQFYQLMTFATSGLADTTTFSPALNGLLYNNGVAVPAWLTKDFYGSPVPATGRALFARNTGVDVGAVQYVPGGTIFPTVHAGTDQTIFLPTSATALTGSATGNGGATIASTIWALVSKPVGATDPTIVTAGSTTTSVTGLVQGVYVFQLSGTDSNGNTSTDQMQVTVAVFIPPTPCNCITTHVKTLFQ